MNSFSSLALSKEMLNNLNDLKYETMTPIQEKSIPQILNGKDILAQAKTGSGKTAAFGIGLLHNLDVTLFRVQAMILCPTRELAEQVTSELRRIAKFKHNIKLLTLTGGLPLSVQELSLKHQAHIVVGTPGRVHKLLQRGCLNLEHIKTFVLDEADRMLDMGFSEQIQNIMTFIPAQHQTLCFSATFPDEIKKLSKSILTNPIEITVETHHNDTVIKQLFYKTPSRKKGSAVLALLSRHRPGSTLIFCNTKDTCRRVMEELNRSGLHCLAIHGDLEQKERNEVLVRFANGSTRVLIATDVAARGIDIDDLDAVINFNLPFEKETYVHRIGRTGRAGREGLALSLMEPGEDFRIAEINDYCKSNFEPIKPDFEYSTNNPNLEPKMVTLSINGGRKNKISPGHLLGALTSKNGINGSDIGKINRMDNITFVAVKRKVAKRALHVLETETIKGRKFLAMIHD
jgi:ATP-dependent RNA helicase DbpA